MDQHKEQRKTQVVASFENTIREVQRELKQKRASGQDADKARIRAVSDNILEGCNLCLKEYEAQEAVYFNEEEKYKVI